jgi:tripartite-type tricarboxylate transporter receptor subunit TctC
VPQAPTAKAEGYGDLYIWTGMAAPAGVPKDIIARLSSVLAQTLQDKPVQDMMKKLGVNAFYLNPEQMSARVATDAKWIGDLMTELGMAKKN